MTRTTKQKTLGRKSRKLISPTGAAVKKRRSSARNNPQSPVPVQANHCSRCYVRIPTGQLQRVLEGKTIQCEHCHQVLCKEAD